jgi:hypothetical protein
VVEIIDVWQWGGLHWQQRFGGLVVVWWRKHWRLSGNAHLWRSGGVRMIRTLFIDKRRD